MGRLFLFFVLFLTFYLASCVDKKEEELRAFPIEDLIEDILLTNASAPQDEEDSTRYLNLYDEVYRRFATDSAHVDQLLKYWVLHPKEFDAIVDRVIARMKRRYDSIEILKPELQLDSKLEDTVQ